MAKFGRLLIDDPDDPATETGLALSGGGYRAMLFHAGAIWRMNELGLLKKLDRISSVSGGSITAAALALAWKRLTFDAENRATNLHEKFIRPLTLQALDTMDVGAAVIGLAPFASAANVAAACYDRNICSGATLADLPERPRFIFNATSLNTAATVRFRRDYVADYHIGRMEGLGHLKLADVVAASAAFPPFLSPKDISFSGARIAPDPKRPGDLATPPFTQGAVLTDGGVYDNLATETIWKTCRTMFISNSGAPFKPDADPEHNWLQQSLRVVDIALDQCEDLRKRIIVHAYGSGARRGAMWSLKVRDDNPKLIPARLGPQDYREAMTTPTRLARFDFALQALLLKAGYLHAAFNLRKHYGADKGGVASQPEGVWPTP